MSKPLVSVILTYYNHAAYVAQAIESVLNQTYPHLELIIINDESPDTPEFKRIITPYLADPRFKLVNQPNQGVAVSRNTGLALSHGQYLCFLDSDDWLHPEKLARQVGILEEEPDVGMVYCDIQQVSVDGQLLDTPVMRHRASGPMEPNVFEALWINGFFEPSTTLFRRCWYEKAGPLTVGIEGHSDYEFWLRLSALGCTVRHLPDRLVYYRIHSENYSKNTEVMYASRMKARRIIMEKYPDAVLVQAEQVGLKLYALQEHIKYFRDSFQLAEQTNQLLQERLTTCENAKETCENDKETCENDKETCENEKEELARERYRLSLLLVRHKQDLDALQQTLTVRIAKKVMGIRGLRILQRWLSSMSGTKPH